MAQGLTEIKKTQSFSALGIKIRINEMEFNHSFFIN
jgi:hypothetical protein